MRTLFIAFALAATLAAQSDEKYPGQSTHQPPPDGWMCEHQNYDLTVPADHMCSCERMYSEEQERVIEDKQCSVYCHMDHCACPINDPRTHPKEFPK
jgi:hypothetical protein